jgi:putative ABC transport system permease protein
MDVACDASVTLGGCSYGALVLYGVNPLMAFGISMSLGLFAGFITSFFISNIKIEPILASIITLTAVQTFILKLAAIERIVDKKEIKSVLSTLSAFDNSAITLVIVSILCISFFKILNSEYGLAMRVNGHGKIISESLGIDTNQMLSMGLGIGNALSAAAGALIVQISGSFNAGIGNGALIFGLASVIIGERIMSSLSIKGVKGGVIGCFMGTFIYKAAMEIATFGEGNNIGAEYNGIIMALVLIFMTALIHDNKERTIKY